MKKLLFFIFLPFVSFGQFSEVVENEAFKKNTLYSNCLTWVAKSFKSANDVIQMKDSESGKVVVKCILNSAPKSMGVRANGATYATITILCKDGKYKYEFSDIHFIYQQGQIMSYDKSTKAWKEDVDKEAKILIDSLKAEMQKTDDF